MTQIFLSYLCFVGPYRMNGTQWQQGNERSMWRRQMRNRYIKMMPMMRAMMMRMMLQSVFVLCVCVVHGRWGRIRKWAQALERTRRRNISDEPVNGMEGRGVGSRGVGTRGLLELKSSTFCAVLAKFGNLNRAPKGEPYFGKLAKINWIVHVKFGTNLIFSRSRTEKERNWIPLRSSNRVCERAFGLNVCLTMCVLRGCWVGHGTMHAYEPTDIFLPCAHSTHTSQQ